MHGALEHVAIRGETGIKGLGSRPPIHAEQRCEDDRDGSGVLCHIPPLDPAQLSFPGRRYLEATGVASGLPFSTMYVARMRAVPEPVFVALWIVPAGIRNACPALMVTAGFPV